MKTEEEKGEEVLKKRELAAKGLKERADGKPIDPMEDVTSIDPVDKETEVDPLDKTVANTAAAAALGRVR